LSSGRDVLVLVSGVDDAGRGCVVGPLVIAGILVDEKDVPILRSLGVKDSKQLTFRKRFFLGTEIEGIVLKSSYDYVLPDEIDKAVLKGKKFQRLNFLEAKAMANVIDQLNPDVAYVDACDVLAERFGRQIGDLLRTKTKIISEHKADINHPVVSAASILAKVERDSAIESLKHVYGDFGSGYPHDPKLRLFLAKYYKDNGCFPEIVRKSWKTVRDIVNLNYQKKLT
jgi:ribonuclease HII